MICQILALKFDAENHDLYLTKRLANLMFSNLFYLFRALCVDFCMVYWQRGSTYKNLKDYRYNVMLEQDRQNPVPLASHTGE